MLDSDLYNKPEWQAAPVVEVSILAFLGMFVGRLALGSFGMGYRPESFPGHFDPFSAGVVFGGLAFRFIFLRAVPMKMNRQEVNEHSNAGLLYFLVISAIAVSGGITVLFIHFMPISMDHSASVLSLTILTSLSYSLALRYFTYPLYSLSLSKRGY